jgi:hypothetical protein
MAFKKIIFLILISVVFYQVFIYTEPERKIVNNAISLVENYRTTNGKYPKSLNDVGLKYDDMSGPVYYQLDESSNEYIIWFGTSIGSSVVYESKTKKWTRR